MSNIFSILSRLSDSPHAANECFLNGSILQTSRSKMTRWVPTRLPITSYRDSCQHWAAQSKIYQHSTFFVFFFFSKFGAEDFCGFWNVDAFSARFSGRAWKMLKKCRLGRKNRRRYSRYFDILSRIIFWYFGYILIFRPSSKLKSKFEYFNSEICTSLRSWVHSVLQERSVNEMKWNHDPPPW